jgi:hypothetical protein
MVIIAVQSVWLSMIIPRRGEEGYSKVEGFLLGQSTGETELGSLES